MSDTTITPEERVKLLAHVNSGYMTISGEGLKKAIDALEQAEARAEQAEAQVARLNKILTAAQECVLNGDSCSMPEGGPEDCALLHDIADLFASNCCARIDSARLTAERDWLADKLETAVSCPRGDMELECPFDTSPGSETCATIMDSIPSGKVWGQCWKEYARLAVAAGEGE